jgi:cobaltochelatase CobS
MATAAHQALLGAMVALANLTRKGFASGDLSSLMSPRTVIHWAQTYIDLLDVRRAFALSFLNRSDAAERPLIAEFYQRCFDEPLLPDPA